MFLEKIDINKKSCNLKKEVPMSTDWTEGIDLRGVDADELVCRWSKLSGYGKKELFLLFCQREDGGFWRRAMEVELPDMRDPLGVLGASPKVLQSIVDVLAYYGPTEGLWYARGYNTTPTP